ncbi:metallophosphoesterase family protein [Granulicella sp. WH15]|uniref:metallophosphoesterase family protein n=1 Tax=Granulicella sp. WH15 TaxID=2602070 RepID=UPI00136725B3|nr:metallophosphoesterase family protein [Granulicella sp. WH15]QHN03903.1 metallophosphoesterase family protein [Granulicella sp. WH15]
MRIAIVSDIHGNLTALEAVIADLRQTAPDLILHGGDLVQNGAIPAEVIDRIRDLGWPGILGNTDEMLFRPEALTEFASHSPQLEHLFAMIAEIAEFTRQALGEERLEWLRSLPLTQIVAPVALVHASPGDLWRAPMPDASDADLERVYRPLGQPVAVYAHIHRPYIRRLPGLTVANTGSVSLSHDGDPRASYLLIDEGVPSIRRVAYDLDREAALLDASGIPHAGWLIENLKSGSFQMPRP